MFANYLIGLREGLEAALIVSILVAYLVRTRNAAGLKSVWIGVGIAVALSLSFGALLTFTANSLGDEAEEAFAGVMSILAVGFVTWMIFWMRRTARGLKAELDSRMDSAVAVGGVALVVTAFLAVAREGLETSLFVWSTVDSTGSGLDALIGAMLGIATAIALGYLFYRGALRMNLSKFFTWTGAGLIVVAAGVLAYGVHDLQEAGVLPGGDNIAFDVSGVISPDSWYAALLRGTLNLTPETTVLQAIVWVTYLVVVGTLFARAGRSSKPKPSTSEAAKTNEIGVTKA